MWVLVHFDLPTEAKKDRKAYAQFRKLIQKDGFQMSQFSMYRHCSNKETFEERPNQFFISNRLVEMKQIAKVVEPLTRASQNTGGSASAQQTNSI